MGHKNKRPKLHVTIHEAKGLKGGGLLRSLDPFCVVAVGNKRYKSTSIKGGGHCHKFDHGFTFSLRGDETTLSVTLLNKSANAPETVLGHGILSLSDLDGNGKYHGEIPLKRKNGKPGGVVKVSIKLKHSDRSVTPFQRERGGSGVPYNPFDNTLSDNSYRSSSVSSVSSSLTDSERTSKRRPKHHYYRSRSPSPAPHHRSPSRRRRSPSRPRRHTSRTPPPCCCASRTCSVPRCEPRHELGSGRHDLSLGRHELGRHGGRHPEIVYVAQPVARAVRPPLRVVSTRLKEVSPPHAHRTHHRHV